MLNNNLIFTWPVISEACDEHQYRALSTVDALNIVDLVVIGFAVVIVVSIVE